MVDNGSRILIGLSGGADSVCLLQVLTMLREKYLISLNALYIDHGLRPGETDREIQFCSKLCEQHGIPFFTKSIDVKSYAKTGKLNVQEAARQLRYRTYEEAAYEINANKIALGHTCPHTKARRGVREARATWLPACTLEQLAGGPDEVSGDLKRTPLSLLAVRGAVLSRDRSRPISVAVHPTGGR